MPVPPLPHPAPAPLLASACWGPPAGAADPLWRPGWRPRPTAVGETGRGRRCGSWVGEVGGAEGGECEGAAADARQPAGARHPRPKRCHPSEGCRPTNHINRSAQPSTAHLRWVPHGSLAVELGFTQVQGRRAVGDAVLHQHLQVERDAYDGGGGGAGRWAAPVAATQYGYRAEPASPRHPACRPAQRTSVARSPNCRVLWQPARSMRSWSMPRTGTHSK